MWRVKRSTVVVTLGVWLLLHVFVGSRKIVTASQSTGCPSKEVQTLKLLASLPLPHPDPLFNPSWNEGAKVLPALYLARDQINDRPDLLPCHELELIPVDGGCDIAATTAVSTIANGLFNKKGTRVIGMVGPGCSASSLQTAHVMNQPEIELVHIHGAGSHLLEDRGSFPNSLGILGSTQTFVDLSLALMKISGWHNIAILFESGSVYYRLTKESFVEALRSEIPNVSITFASPIYSMFYPLDGVRSSLSRIVFVFTALSHSLRIMCLAYHMRLVYPAYQWVIVGHRLTDIISEIVTFSYDRRIYNCSLRAIVNVSLEGTFFISYQLVSLNSEKPKLAKTTLDRFIELYEDRANSENTSTTYWAYYFYDAVWAWARVLHQLTAKNNEFFNDFRYGNKTVANLIVEKFYASDFEFEGMSGLINFNSNSGYVDRPSHLCQIIDGEERHITYNNHTNIILIDGESPRIISDTVRTVRSVVNPVLIAFFAFLQFLWFFVTVFLHVLTVLYRNSKSVKASSPTLGHFAFAGAYLLIFGIVLLIVLEIKQHPAHVNGPLVLCHIAWAWVLPISFTLTVGTAIVRTWRLYRIFNHYLDPGKVISNTALIIILVIFLSVDLVIAVIWTATDPRKQVIVTHTIEDGPAVELVKNLMCRSQHESVWLIVVLSYKVALFLVMVLLTLLTRHIPNKTFATTSLQVFSYTFSVVSGIGFVLFCILLYFTNYRYDSNISNTILHTTINVLSFLYILCVLSPPLAPVLHVTKCRSCLSRMVSLSSTCCQETYNKIKMRNQESEKH